MRMASVLPDLDASEIAKAVKRPSDFGYSGEIEGMFSSWALGPVIEHRDSGLLDKSNAAALIKALESHKEWSEDWDLTGCSHWAVGWVKHLSYRVIDAEGKATPIARFLKEWWRVLRDEYPIADEDDYTQRESDASWSWISKEGPRQADRLGFKLPDDWAERVWSWWDVHDQGAIESKDDQGACPDREQWRAAFEGCEFQKEE